MNIGLRTVDKNTKVYYGSDIVNDVFLNVGSNMLNISSGINKFKMPLLYTKYIKHQLDHNSIVTDYSMVGNYSLLMCLMIYEKLIASNNCKVNNKYADNLSITIGATQSIKYLFDYYEEKYKEYDVLLIGHNYYLFYKSCESKNLNFYELVSSSEHRIAPSIEEIEAAVNQINTKMIVLTVPLNPSGESYTENEVREIIEIAKQKGIIVCFDKCQIDEFANVFNYINIGKIAIESNYLDNIIIINSQSKIRSIPGIRSGYIITNDKMLQYIKNRKEEEIYCPPTICVAALIIDLIFRVFQYGVYTLKKEYSFTRVVRIFKHAIRTSSDTECNKNYLLRLLESENLYEDYFEFKKEIETNWQTVKANYEFLNNELKDDLAAITLLEGGFNFCIKLKKTQGYSQKAFLKNVLETLGLQLLSEDFFTLYPKQDTSTFWIRISAAEELSIFKKNILELKRYVSNMG